MRELHLINYEKNFILKKPRRGSIYQRWVKPIVNSEKAPKGQYIPTMGIAHRVKPALKGRNIKLWDNHSLRITYTLSSAPNTGTQ